MLFQKSDSYTRTFRSGFSLVETMIGLGLLAAVGVGAMKLFETQKVSDRGMKSSNELARDMVSIKQILNGKETCELNFKGQQVGSNGQISELKNAANESIYKLGQKLADGSYELTDIRLGNHSELTQRTSITFSFKRIGQGNSSASLTRTTNLFTKVVDGKIEECLNPNDITTDSLKKKFCRDVDPNQTEDCEDNFNNLLRETKRLYCGSGHPFLQYDATTEKCLPLDANKQCATGFVKGYDQNNNLVCYEPPIGPVEPPKECEAWSAWSPAPSSACLSASVTQTRTCLAGLTETQTQVVQGTRNDAGCCSSWSDWSPSSDSKCRTETVAQTRSCTAGWTGNETRNVAGTKTDGNCAGCTINHPMGWSVPSRAGESCHCSEYYMAPGGAGSQSILAEGRTKIFEGKFCQARGKFGTQDGHGSVEATCRNGQLILSNHQCEAGDVR